MTPRQTEPGCHGACAAELRFARRAAAVQHSVSGEGGAGRRSWAPAPGGRTWLPLLGRDEGIDHANDGAAVPLGQAEDLLELPP